MKTIKLLAIAFMALTIVSCSKSKEEKFIEDFEELVETLENSSYDELKGVGDKMLKTFESKMDKLYGIDINKSDQMIDCIESSDLKLDDDQKEKVIDLQERIVKRMSELRKEKEAPQNSEVDTSDDRDNSSISSDDDSDSDILLTDDDSNSDISSSDSEDWDALLKAYEEYVDEYISYANKAANGDIDALTEYPALMEKAQEFSKKMQNAQSDMSTSQWARYNKITAKMLKAAQEMR